MVVSKRKSRNFGLDLVKVLACILVICLHSLTPTSLVVKNNIFNSSVYYSGTIAIPIFFMASSYFVLNKKDISFYYVLRRVVDIFFIIVGWVLVYSICQLIVKHRFIFLEELKGTAFITTSSNHFYHFWFFGALIFMLIISPLLWYILHNNFKRYLFLTFILTLICVGVDISLHLDNSINIQNIPQVFRIYLYIEYYLLGGLIGNLRFIKIKEYVKKHIMIISFSAIFLYFIVIIYSIWNRNVIHWDYAEANYGNILVIFTSVLILIIFSVLNPKNKKLIEFIIPATMGIYMIHPFFINKLMKIHFFYEYPVFMVPILFVLCLIIVEIALRIPVIKRFFKL